MVNTSPLPVDIRRRTIARLLEKHDPAKTRHKPLTLLRAEIRRTAEQFLEQEAAEHPQLSALIDEILNELPHLSPLEELFRDESINEFLILSHNQIIRRAGESWLPTSVHFHNAEHFRDVLKNLLQTATPIGDVPKTSDGGADALLPNGYRVIAILPPRVLGLSPTAVFRRVAQNAAATPAPAGSGTIKAPSGVVPTPSGATAASLSQRHSDPWERLRQRITERIIDRLAANGVYDISRLPIPELRRVIAMYVVEFDELEKLNLDHAGQDRLTLEILNAMKR